MIKKIKLKKLISLLLCITMIIPNSINVFANDLVTKNIGFEDDDIEEYQTIIDESLSVIALDSEEQIDYLIQMVENMTPEARSILENHLKNEDLENYKFYIENINSNAGIDTLSIEVDTYAVDAMASLGRDLAALGLSSEIVIALKGAAAEILSLVSITPAGVLTILTAAAISVIIASNWDTIGPKWNQIASAFQNAIGKSASAIDQGFVQANTQFNQRLSDSEKAKGRFRGCPKTRSIAKHIDASFVDTFLRNSDNKPYKIFYSSKNRIAMIVIKIGKGNQASLNDSLGIDSTSTHKYNQENINLSGFTMYLLYDCANDQLFHCHVRYRTDDTNEMRRANGLDWMVYPELKRDMKYDSYSSNLRLNGSQLN